MVDDHVVEESPDHKVIVPRGFDFNFFNQDEEGIVKEGSSEFTHVLMFIKLWPWDWITQLNSTNQKVDEDNGKALNKGNV